MHDKTDDQLRADLAEMRRLIPKTTSAERRAIYQTTANRIQAELDKRAADKQAPVGHNLPPAEPVRKAPETEPNKKSPPTNFSAPGTAHQPTQSEFPGSSAAYRIPATGSGETPKVVIEWCDGTSSTLTEGEARSAFTSRLRDLVQSKLATQGRLDQLPLQYDTFHRAVGYYQALAAFWGRKPSARDLDLGGMSAMRRTIFDMIAERVAEPVQQQS